MERGQLIDFQGGIADSFPMKKSEIYATKNDLPASLREKMISLLNGRLVDSIDLQTQCKLAHWNVKGPDFIALHELFDKINGEVEEYVDLIAERVVQLGGVADGSVQSVVGKSQLKPYGARGGAGQEHVEALSAALAAYGKLVRAAIDTADQVGDADTADIFTEISRGTDKWLWFVEAHLQAER